MSLAGIMARRAKEREDAAIAAGTATIPAAWNAGVADTKSLYISAGMAFDAATGDDKEFSEGLKRRQELEAESAKWSKGRRTSIEDVNSVGDLASYAAWNIGTMVPSVVESALASGVGAAIGFVAGTPAAPGAGSAIGAGVGTVAGFVAKRAVKKFLENQIEKGLAKGLAKDIAESQAQRALVTKVGQVGAMAANSYVQGVGDVYQETAGADGRGNLAASLIAGVPYAAVDTFVDLSLMTKALTGTAGENTIKRYVKAMTTGAVQEGTQETIQELDLVLAGLASGKTYTGQEVASRLANSFAGAAIGGGILGAPGGRKASSPVANTTPQSQQNTAITGPTGTNVPSGPSSTFDPMTTDPFAPSGVTNKPVDAAGDFSNLLDIAKDIEIRGESLQNIMKDATSTALNSADIAEMTENQINLLGMSIEMAKTMTENADHNKVIDSNLALLQNNGFEPSIRLGEDGKTTALPQEKKVEVTPPKVVAEKKPIEAPAEESPQQVAPAEVKNPEQAAFDALVTSYNEFGGDAVSKDGKFFINGLRVKSASVAKAIMNKKIAAAKKAGVVPVKATDPAKKLTPQEQRKKNVAKVFNKVGKKIEENSKKNEPLTEQEKAKLAKKKVTFSGTDVHEVKYADLVENRDLKNLQIRPEVLSADYAKGKFIAKVGTMAQDPHYNNYYLGKDGKIYDTAEYAPYGEDRTAHKANMYFDSAAEAQAALDGLEGGETQKEKVSEALKTGEKSIKEGRNPVLIEQSEKAVEEIIKPRIEKALAEAPKKSEPTAPKKLSKGYTEKFFKSLVREIAKKSPALGNFVVEKGKILATNLEVAVNVATDLKDGVYSLIGDKNPVFVPNNVDKDTLPEFMVLDKETKNASVDAQEFTTVLSKAVKSLANKDDSRMELQSANITIANGKMSVTTTDTFRLSHYTIDANVDSEIEMLLGDPSILAKALPLVGENIQILTDTSSRMIEIRGNKGSVMVRKIAGKFPPADRIVPSFKFRYEISKKALLDAVDSLLPYAQSLVDNKKLASVRMDRVGKTGDIKLTVEGKTKDDVEIDQSVTVKGALEAIDSTGEVLQQGTLLMPIGDMPMNEDSIGHVNISYLKDSLSQVDGESASISMVGVNERRPFHVGEKNSLKMGPKDLKESVKKVAAAQKESKAKNEDIGEKIGGAHKDRNTAAKESLSRELGDEDYTNLSKKELLPELDYPALSAEGISEPSLASFAYLQATVGRKPTKSYRLREWVAKVKMTREMISTFVNAAGEQRKIIENKMAEMLETNKSFAATYEMYKEFDFINNPKIRSFTALAETYQRTMNGDNTVFKRYFLQKDKNIVNGVWTRKDDETLQDFLKKVGEYINEPVTKKKYSIESGIQVYTYRRKPGAFIQYSKNGKEIKLAEFATLEEARTAKKENMEAYVKTVEESTNFDETSFRIDDNKKPTKSYRNGKDVSAKTFMDTFGFRGIEFGNWVSQDERIPRLNFAFDAFKELAALMGVPDKAMSLNGKLGFAFGSRGIGKFAAHYESDKVVINITKKNGSGTIAHEWWHALDNFFGGKLGGKSSFFTDNQQNYDREELKVKMSDLMKIIKHSDVYERSGRADRYKGKKYYTNNTELGARAFEVYIKNLLETQGRRNDFLVNIREGADMTGKLSDVYPYAHGEEVKLISDAVDNFVKEIKVADENAVLYALPDNMDRRNQRDVYAEEAVARAREIASRFKISNLDAKILDLILTGDGGEAMAASFGNKIAFEKIVKIFTADHEIGHTLFRNMDKFEIFKRNGITKEGLIAEMKELYPRITDMVELEEKLMENLELYLVGKNADKPVTMTGKIKKFFDSIYNWLNRVFLPENITMVNAFYEQIATGTNRDVVEISSQGALPLEYTVDDQSMMKFKKSDSVEYTQAKYEALRQTAKMMDQKISNMRAKGIKEGDIKPYIKNYYGLLDKIQRLRQSDSYRASFIRKSASDAVSLVTKKGNLKVTEVFKEAWRREFGVDVPKSLREMLTRNDSDLFVRGAAVSFTEGKKLANGKWAMEKLVNRLENAEKNKAMRAEITQKFKDKAVSKDTKRKLAVNYTKNNLPTVKRGKFLNMVAKATTDSTLEKVIASVDSSRNIFERQQLKKQIEKIADKIHLLPVEFQKDIISIMNQIELKHHTKNFMDRIRGNAAIFESLSDEMKRNTSRAVFKELNILNKIPFEQVTTQQLMDINNKLQQLSIVGRNVMEEMAQKKLETKEEIIAGLTKNPINLDAATAKQKNNVIDRDNITKWSKFKESAHELDMDLLGTDRAFDTIDGGHGSFDGAHMQMKKEIDFKTDEFQQKRDGFDNIWKQVISLHPEMERETPGGIWAQKELSLKEKVNLIKNALTLDAARQKRIYTYWADQNGYKDVVIKNGQLTLEQFDEQLASLTQTDKDIIEFQRRFFKDAHPILAAAYAKNENKILGDVGDSYFPMYTDRDRAKPMEEQVSDLYNQKNVKNSSVEHREDNRTRPLSFKGLDDFFVYVDNFYYYTEMADTVKKYRQAVDSKEYLDAVGEKIHGFVSTWLSVIAKKGGYLKQPNNFEKILKYVNGNLSTYYLGWNPTSYVKQYLAWFNGVMGIGFGNMTTGTSMMLDPKWREFIRTYSPEMVHRAGGETLLEDLRGSSISSLMREKTMAPLQAGDYRTASAVWLGAYQKYMVEHGLDVDLNSFNKDAGWEANRVVRHFQGTAHYKDVPQKLVNEHKVLWRTFFAFESFGLSNWAQLRYDIPNTFSKDKVAGTQQLAWWVTQQLGNKAITKAWIVILAATFGYDDDSEEESMMKIAFSVFADAVPILSKITSTIEYKKIPIPILQAMQDLAATFGYALDPATKSESRVKNILRATSTLAGFAYGIPPKVFLKLVEQSMKE